MNGSSSGTPVTADNAPILGRGFRFPIQADARGGISVSEGPDRIRDAIWIIIRTGFGERVMRPTFGAGADEDLFGPNNGTSRARLATKIRDARATRAFAFGTAIEPEAVRFGPAGAAARVGATRMTGRPSRRKPGPSGKPRWRPRRSSSVSVPRSRSTATISPHQSVVTSSTTAPISAGASTARPRLGTRQSVERTSEP